MKSFITDFWAAIFGALRWISLFQIIYFLVPPIRKSYLFVDGWVLFNLLTSITVSIVSKPGSSNLWIIMAIIYGGIRVLEIFIYQINVLLFDEYRTRKAGKTYVLRSFRRTVILLLHNYIEIIFWFTLFYRHTSWAFENNNASLESFLISLNFSFVTMTSFGYNSIQLNEPLGYILTLIQSTIGLSMALLILARFISLIPPPRTSDKLEK